MLYVNLPTREELIDLAEMRSDICLSIYLQTTPITQNQHASQIELKNLLKSALVQLEKSGHDKKRIEMLEENITHVMEQEDFWEFHAHTLSVLATPDCIRTFCLANRIETHMEIADRFHIKPLFRALSFTHSAYILALSENEVRLVEFFSDAAPEVIKVSDMPKDALDAAGKASLTSSLSYLFHESGSRGYKSRLFTYARKIDDALRPFLLQSNAPLILVATEPMHSIFRSVASFKNLVEEAVSISPDRLNLTELVDMARPVLDRHNHKQVGTFKELYEERAGQKRASTELAEIARAATFGMVSHLMVDFDMVLRGAVDEAGEITLSDKPEAYGILDEIVRRAFLCGADVLAVRKEDMKGKSGVAAIFRYAFE